MSDLYRDIIVYLDASLYTEGRLEVAAAMAQQYDAKLTGVHISTNAAFEGNWRDRAAEISDRFEAVARARGVPFRYRAASGELVSNLFVHSADLFVATQPHVDTAHLAYDAVPEKRCSPEGCQDYTALQLAKERNRKERPSRMERLSRSHSRSARRAAYSQKRPNASLSSRSNVTTTARKPTWTPSSRI